MRKLAILINLDQCPHFGIIPEWAKIYTQDFTREGCSVAVYYTGQASAGHRNKTIQKQLIDNGYHFLVATIPDLRSQPEQEAWKQILRKEENAFDALAELPTAWVSFDENSQRLSPLNRLTLRLATEFAEHRRAGNSTEEEVVNEARCTFVATIVEQIFRAAKWEK